jgi:5-fold beta-flower protein
MKLKLILPLITMIITVSGYASSEYSRIIFYGDTTVVDTTILDSATININKDHSQIICGNKSIGFIDIKTGVIRNPKDMKVGEFMSSGEVRNGNGELLGTIVGKNFKDINNATLGYINDADEIFDLNGDKLGKIESDYLIKDVNNDLIGKVSEITNKKWLAAYYFFFFQ